MTLALAASRGTAGAFAGNPHRWAHKRHARRSPITIKIVTLRERCTMTSHAASALAALPIPKATRKAARQSASSGHVGIVKVAPR
jgi:hypothetical protein